MKYKPFFVPGLLLAYLVYLAFTPTTIAHSIIFLALASLYGFQEFLTRPEKTDYLQKLAQLEERMNERLTKQKEELDVKVQAVDAEVTKMVLNTLRPSASAASKKPENKIVF
jgi:nicotinic acid mononucleotide adenylyltransferase